MSSTPTTWVEKALSPYALAKILSSALSEATGTEVTIAPQQLYGAVRSGTLKTSRFDSGHIKVNPSDANAFIQDRIDRQNSDEEETDEAEAADEVVAVS